MHEFRYKGDALYCEDVPLEELAKRFSTPLYVYSYKTILDHYEKLKEAFKEIKPLICYSLKANSNLAILKILVKRGAGLDIVSGGELYKALKAGCPAQRIVYASVGKTPSEIRQAIKARILFLNVESLPELETINVIAKEFKRVTKVALRINPAVEPKTHRFIITGRITNKFGIDFESAFRILKERARFKYVDICGLHIHIGSQITESAPYIASIRKLLDFIYHLKREGISIGYLNIGGGLGIIYHQETPQSAQGFAFKVLPLLRNTGLKIIMEPGRFIVGNAGVLITKVLYIKETPQKKFAIVDAGMNDLIRPTLYGAYHQILPLKAFKKKRLRKVDVVGPICESADFFAQGRSLPPLEEGSYLAIMGAGAYGFSMASNYNLRLRPAEVLVKDKKYFLIRKRETFKDLIRREVIPEGI